ncbi:MAG: hypothetical protein P8179_16285 [Candidatus Thiodiazotropha sp.]
MMKPYPADETAKPETLTNPVGLRFANSTYGFNLKRSVGQRAIHVGW